MMKDVPIAIELLIASARPIYLSPGETDETTSLTVNKREGSFAVSGIQRDDS